MQPILELRQICKSFPGVVANDHIDLTLYRGQIHTILGENGAGKSTLMNIISGLYAPDSGTLKMSGALVHFRSPAQAIAAGIGMVHQHFMLIPNQTVAENIILGTSQPFFLRKQQLHQQIEELGERFGLQLNPRKRIQELSVGEQQRVEILKVLFRGATVLILDEPTAVLTPQESESLYRVLREMKADGKSMLFISHKMKEVMELSDQVTILRHGKVVSSFPKAETHPHELAKLMMGESTIEVAHLEEEVEQEAPPAQDDKVVVELRNAGVRHPMGHWLLEGVDLRVRAGEIVGLAGVSGSGQGPLAEVLTGLRKLDCGEYLFENKPLQQPSVDELIKKGVGYIPEDRKRLGIAPHLSVAENFLLRDLKNPEFQQTGWLRRNAIQQVGRERMRKFDVRAASERVPVGQLSGGNIQKVILARETSRSMRFLLAAQPVRGLDIHATAFIQHMLLQARQQGVGILLISEDLEELLLLSDYLYVICRGSIVGEMPRHEARADKIGLMMTGEQN